MQFLRNTLNYTLQDGIRNENIRAERTRSIFRSISLKKYLHKPEFSTSFRRIENGVFMSVFNPSKSYHVFSVKTGLYFLSSSGTVSYTHLDVYKRQCFN